MILARERGRRVDIDCGGTQETDEVNWELKKKNKWDIETFCWTRREQRKTEGEDKRELAH